MRLDRLTAHHRSGPVAIACAAAIVAAAMLAVWPLFARAQVHGLDILATVYRVFVLDLSIERGLVYPRIAPDLGFGYGLPLLQYYPPAAAYMSELLHLAGLGFVRATSVVFFLCIIAGGLGAYSLVRRLAGDTLSALTAGLAYALAPYSLAAIYTRGAAAEALGLAVLPWFLAAFLHLANGLNPMRVVLAASATCALALSHNGVSLIAIPSLAAAVAFVTVRQRRYREGIVQAGAMLLGLGLSAFFWFPALAETGYVQMQAMVQGFYSVTANLTDASQLVQTTLDFDYAAGRFSRLGLAQIILAGISVAVLPLLPPSKRRVALLATVTVVLCSLLQTEAASPFWTNVPLVAYLQFPWRLLGFSSLAIAILAGSLPGAANEILKRARPANEKVRKNGENANGTARGVLGLLVVAAIAALLVKTSLSGVFATWGGSTAAEGLSESTLSRQDLDFRGAMGFELFTDYWPASASPSPGELAQPTGKYEGQPYVTEPPPALAILRDGPLDITVESSSVSTHALRLHAFFMPGWQGAVDGIPVVVRASTDLGLATIDVPPGRHLVQVWFGDTAVRTLSTAISVLSVGAATVLLLSLARRRLGVVLASVILVIAVLSQARTAPAVEPGRLAISFGEFATLAGARVDRKAGASGEAVDVRLYWYANTAVGKDYKVFVHLVKPDGGPPVAQHDGRPVEGFTSTSWWRAGELIIDDHRIVLPPSLPPGQYLLVAGLYDQNGNVPVAPQTETVDGGRAVIASLLVTKAP